ncbi:uncharacterized protein J5F26_000235 isoform 2-T5 [Ciconia maguari]
MVTELYKQTRTIQNILRTNLSIMNCFKNTRRKLYMAEAVFSERRGLRIFGCPQETIDGFILDDGCNQLKSAFTGFSEPVRKNGAAKCLDLVKGFSDVSTVASVPVCLQDCVLFLVGSFLQQQGKKGWKNKRRWERRKKNASLKQKHCTVKYTYA